MANYVSNANGNWSDSTKWTPAGVPGNGDFASIGHNIVINQNIGTTGNGIKRITITAGALTFDAAANRTIYFASTGTDPIGSGTATAPATDATMFGFFNNAGGKINLVGTASAVLTITSGNAISPWYMLNRHPGSNITLKYLDLYHVGTLVDNFQGLALAAGYENHTILLDHLRFTDLLTIAVPAPTAFGDPTNLTVSNAFFTGTRASSAEALALGTISGAGFSAGSFTITDNTETNPVNDAEFVRVAAMPAATTFSGNAVLGTSSASRGLIAGHSSSATGNVITENLAVNSNSASGGYIIASPPSSTVSNNYSEGSFNSAVATLSGAQTTVTGNFLSQRDYSVDAQGCIISPSPASSIYAGNVLLYESVTLVDPMDIALMWSTGINTTLWNHNTLLGPPAVNGGARGVDNHAIGIGEAGAAGSGNIFRNNLVCGWVNALRDFSTVSYANDYAGSGIHHNAYHDNTADFLTPSGNGEANFWDGVNPHPSNAYAEVSMASSPNFIDPTRRVTQWDVSIGGPGTISNVFDQLARRSGFGGTYNTAYTIAALVAFTLSGFLPQNATIRTQGSDGLTIGAINFDLVTRTKTQTGVARLVVRNTKTQTGVSRIGIVTTKTQTGKASIRNTTLRTQTGVARIGDFTTLKTQTGKARISATTAKTQTGKTSILKTTTKTQTGKARISATTVVKTQTGKARIRAHTTRTQSGTAFILNSAVGPQLIIGSTVYLPLESTFKISKVLSAAWTASCDVWYSGGAIPVAGEHVSFFLNGVLRFGGVVLTADSEGVPGRPANSFLHLTFTGFQSYADRAIAAILFTVVMGGTIGNTFYELWRLYLQAQFGVTKVGNAGPAVTLGEQLFHYVTVTEAFNQLRDQSPGWDWWIDDNKLLVFQDTTPTTPTAPFTLRDGDANTDEMIVSSSNSRFRNKQWVLPAADILELWTDTITAIAGQVAFSTQYVLTEAPGVTVDGISQTVTPNSGAVYYVPDGIGVFFAVAPGAGKVIAISYTNPFPMAYSAQDDASIAAVGLYEAVYQSKNITDADTARAFAQGLLDTYGTNGNFPEKISFTYNSKRQAAWLTPGLVVDVDRTFPRALGYYTVEEVQSEEQGCIWRHSVTLRAGLGEVNESQLLEILRTATRTQIISNSVGASAGVTINDVVVQVPVF